MYNLTNANSEGINRIIIETSAGKLFQFIDSQ